MPSSSGPDGLIPPRRGAFITLEGGEGAGKTTLTLALEAALTARGRTVLRTREPGGAPGAEAIRSLLVSGETGRWSPLSELLLISAARAEHLRARIRPALEAGHWVLCDRFIDSTRAYQGFGHGLDPAVIEQISAPVLAGLMPDLTLILDVPPEIGLRRAADRAGAAGASRFEALDPAFHQRVAEGFRHLAQADPMRCRLLDASLPPAHLLAEALAAIEGLG